MFKAGGEVRWFKDGNEIFPSKNILFQSDGRKRILVIKKAAKSHLGAYTCDCGTDKTTADLNIEGNTCSDPAPPSHLGQDSSIRPRPLPFFKTPPLSELPFIFSPSLITPFLSGDFLDILTCFGGGLIMSSPQSKARVIGLMRPLKDVTVTAGETATFECELSYEGIAVEWFLGGTKLEPSDRKLNSHSVSHSFVPSEPAVEFTKPLEDQTVEEEATATLECEVSREGAEVRWFRDGQEIRKTKKYEMIVDGRKRALVIHDCTLDDSRTYACDAKDFKTSCFLNVEPPHVEFTKPLHDFISRPQSQEVVEGEKAEFTCSVSKDTYEVKWLKDDKELEAGDKYQMVSDGKRRTLVIKNCEPKDEGGYVVMIGPTRASADLTVLGKPRVKSQKCHVELAKEGQEIVLNCEVNTDGAKAKWLKNEDTVFESSKYVMVQRDNVFSLRIKDAQKGDEANYSINLTNQRGEQAKSACNLTVKGQWSMVTVTAQITFLAITQEFTLTDCNWTGWQRHTTMNAYPKAEADWLYNNLSLPKDNIYTSADRTEYRLKDPMKSDEGRYKIIIKNKHGEGEAFINLDVIDVPDAPLNVIVGNVTKFGCTVSWETPESDGGSPITSYIIELRDRTSVKWSPVQVTKADELSAIVNDVIENKEYIFRVKAQNKAGVGKPSVASQPRPSPPLNLSWQDQNKSSVQLTWETPLRNGGSIITGYIVERCEEGSDKWLRCNARLCPDLFYKVSGLKYGAKYNYRVFAENAAGVSDPSNIIGPLLADDTHGEKDNAFTDGKVERKLILIPITGYPTPVAKWTCGEKELTTADERVFLMTKSTFTELVVTPSVRPDKGIYTLQLENDEKNKELLTVQHFLVQNSAPSAPKDFKVLEVTRQHVHLTWEAPEHDGGSPLTGYQVEKRDVSRKTWVKVQHQHLHSTLCVTGLTEGQWYAYRVRALNRLGASRVNFRLILVLIVYAEPPEIQLDAKLLAGLTAKAGSKIELPAEVKGKPEPRVKWTKADLVLKPDDRVSIDTKPGHSTVTVAKTKRDDSSTYIIEATNDSGRATATVDVNILGKTI
uniref:Uncharacterized protein n=1 Tax=Lates calcarifer TaxID=8187 RepID=A0A4W6E3Q2_LATCA